MKRQDDSTNLPKASVEKKPACRHTIQVVRIEVNPHWANLVHLGCIELSNCICHWFCLARNPRTSSGLSTFWDGSFEQMIESQVRPSPLLSSFSFRVDIVSLFQFHKRHLPVMYNLTEGNTNNFCEDFVDHIGCGYTLPSYLIQRGPDWLSGEWDGDV